MKKLIKFPDRSEDFVLEDGDYPLIDEEILASEISRVSGVSIGIVNKVLDAQSECFIKAGIVKDG